MRQYAGQPDTDVVMMAPDDYLSLAPQLQGTDAEAKAGKSLRKSLAAGDEIEAIPTLDVSVDKAGAKVTGQDGRHRAMLAKENGIDLIPVAVKRSGQGPITELEGMQGALLPYDFQRYQPPNTPAGSVPAAYVDTAGPMPSQAAQAAVPLQDEPGYTYGSVLPFRKKDDTGDIELAWPEMIRSVVRGVYEGGQEATGQRPVGDPGAAQDIFAAASLGAPGAGGNALKRMAREPVALSPERQLASEGVRLTPGQMLGGAAKTAEEKASSIPVVGDMIRGAQRNAIHDFNVAAYNQVLGQIGDRYTGSDVGTEGIKVVGDRLGAAYDRVLGDVTWKPDQGFLDDIGALNQRVSEMPADQARRFVNILNGRVMKRLEAGQMDGDTFKQVESELSQKSRVAHGSEDAAERDLGDALDEVNAALRGALERTNPGKGAELRTLNRAWAMFSRIRRAAGNRVKSFGVFTPSDLLTASKLGDRTAGRGVFARGDALMQDFATNAEKVIGSSYPDSGTAGRLLLAGGALSLTNHPALAMGAVAGAVPYMPLSIRLANNLLARSTAGRLSPEAGVVRNALSQRGPLFGPALLSPTNSNGGMPQ